MSDPDRPRFYTDENMQTAVVNALRQRGVDVLRCQDAGMRTADDIDHLTLATGQQRILVTRDDDFLKMHATWMAEDKSHTGIVYIQRKNWNNIGLIVDDLLLIHGALLPGEATNFVWHI